VLPWQRRTLPEQGDHEESSLGASASQAQGLPYPAHPLQMWFSACFSGCLPHKNFAVGLQRQIDVCCHHRFAPNLCQHVLLQPALCDSWLLAYPQQLWADVSEKV